jgi:hypothetical protein
MITGNHDDDNDGLWFDASNEVTMTVELAHF